MKRNIFIVALLAIVGIGTSNVMMVEKQPHSWMLTLDGIEALAQTETGCPQQKCDAGGCGSSQCSISQNYPFGFGGEMSVTAQAGNFACCYKDSWGNTHANSYPNSCCH